VAWHGFVYICLFCRCQQVCASMPRATSKKSKGKGASSSGSRVGVRNPDYVVRMENCLGRALLSERCIDLNNLIGSNIPQQVDDMGWRQFVTTAHRINERVVREFYAAMVPAEFEKGTPVKVRGVDVEFNIQDINRYYGTRPYRELDTGVPKLSIFSRYNEDLARELRMPHVEGPWDSADHQLLQHDLELDWAFWVIFLSSSLKPSSQITITVFELAKLLYCIKHHEGLDVGKLIMRAIIRAGKADDLVLPFPALITHFCEQAGVEEEQGDRIAQMDGPLNSRTFNDISAQRREAGLRPVATRKRRRRDEAARAAAAAAEADAAATEEDPGAVPAGDRRPDWMDEMLQRPAWVDEIVQRPAWVDEIFRRQDAIETRQTSLESEVARLTRAIQESRLSASERHGGAGPSSQHGG
jgi:hypothetical protein